MSEIVEPDDMPQRMHPTFQAAVSEFSNYRNVIGPYFPLGRVSLFSLATEEDNVQFHEIQISERLFCSGRAELIESWINSFQTRLE